MENIEAQMQKFIDIILYFKNNKDTYGQKLYSATSLLLEYFYEGTNIF